jgi:hypothetical protein
VVARGNSGYSGLAAMAGPFWTWSWIGFLPENRSATICIAKTRAPAADSPYGGRLVRRDAWTWIAGKGPLDLVLQSPFYLVLD